MLKHIFACACLAAVAVPATAQVTSAVSLNSDVMVERSRTAPDGVVRVVLEQPATVVPGDTLVFVLRYENTGRQPATNFVVTNPLPEAVRFNGTADRGASVSVDAGRTWGQLSALRVREVDGSMRPARAEDVTHIRWAFAEPIAAGQSGRLMFRGIVR
jgi:uncharacterized repeat protein (TIGR01451 family)